MPTVWAALLVGLLVGSHGDPAGYTCARRRPLLWRATKGDADVYIVGSYHLKASEMETPAIVARALSCVDVGYFQLPCPLNGRHGRHPEVAHYLQHCSFYPASPADQDEAGACPWRSPHSMGNGTVLCDDGTLVSNWSCASEGHGDRMQCPPDYPHMCALRLCGEGHEDYCCSNARCNEYGGLRACSSPPCAHGYTRCEHCCDLDADCMCDHMCNRGDSLEYQADLGCDYVPDDLFMPRDSMAARLPAGDLKALQEALSNIVTVAPGACEEKALKYTVTIMHLGSMGFKMALYPYFSGATQFLDPSDCSTGSEDAPTYEDELRAMLENSSRPTFGLEDVESQCRAMQGNTIAEDVALARFISQRFKTLDAAKQFARSVALVPHAFRCGDLDALADLQIAFKSLPWLADRVIADRSRTIAEAIQRAVHRHAGKTIAAVVDALHLTEAFGGKGVLALLQDAGFHLERMRDDSSLSCSPSTNVAPSAADMDVCLEPTVQMQPASCSNFALGFSEKVGGDFLLGRQRDDSGCAACEVAKGPCSCTVQWRNVTAFRRACSEGIGNVPGVVLELDLTKNPGSRHSNSPLSERKILSLTQECYATTCNVTLLADTLLRSWYGKFGELVDARAILRPMRTPPTSPGADPAAPGAVVAHTPSPATRVHLRNSPPRPWSLLLVPLWCQICLGLVTLMVCTAAVATRCKPGDPKQRRDIRLRGFNRVSDSEEEARLRNGFDVSCFSE